MSDPTYDKAMIAANPVWDLAFILSKLHNDMAPLGWSKYIREAEYLHYLFKIERRKETP